MNDIKQKVSQLAGQIADVQGVELFDVELIGTGKLLIRVTIDKEGGVTLDDCERFSKSLGAVFDVEDPVPGSYTLEVSSPGLDRPLKSLEDYEKNKGKLVRVVTSEKIENQNFFIGRILEIEDNFLKLLVNRREINIPFNKISRARLEIEL
ncbi:MAG: ribosome maturation factor RimP [Nitrospirae bacterium]|jgi:ribosome maturation factor RimP|nr:ribosome maturation factor RimP [Nitrospirota bacterium]